jgi:hypothetical protein
MHGCDNYPIQVILNPKAYHDPIYRPNVASYFQGNTLLYTYDIFQTSADLWAFNIRTIDSPDLAQNQSALLYPSISKITYNFIDNTVSGNCTSPSNETFTCLEGSFNFYDCLSFNLTDLRSNSATYIRAVHKKWAFYDDAPSVVLKDSSCAQVLRTAGTRMGDCTELKLCAAQNNGASVTVPIGLILIRQMDYAIYCTTPQPTTVTKTVTLSSYPTFRKQDPEDPFAFDSTSVA